MRKAKNMQFMLFLFLVNYYMQLRMIKNVKWITYRRYSEFNDLHMTIRKRYPALREFIHLPNKSFMNNTSPDVRLKRQKELNDYLVVSSSDFH